MRKCKNFLTSNFNKLRTRILSVVENVKKCYDQVLNWIKNTIKNFKNFLQSTYNNLLNKVLSLLGLNFIQFYSFLCVFILSIIIYVYNSEFWINDTIDHKTKEYLIDTSLLQNIILAILAFFVPFVVAAYSNIFSVTQEKNETITEKEKNETITEQEKIKEKIKDFDKLVLVNTVLQPNATFKLTIFSVTFLSLIHFLVDKFGNFIYNLVPIILLFCVFKFWNIFQNILIYSTDGAFLYQIEFLKSLQFTSDTQKNQKIADKMLRAWEGIWVQEFLPRQEFDLMKVFLAHLQRIHQTMNKDSDHYFLNLGELVKQFNDNIQKRHRRNGDILLSQMFENILQNIEKINENEVKIFGLNYIHTNDHYKNKNIYLFSFFQHIVNLLIALIQQEYQSNSSIYFLSHYNQLTNLAFTNDDRYFKDILFKIFECEANLPSGAKLQLSGFENEKLIRVYFLIWLIEGNQKLIKQLFLHSEESKNYSFFWTLFPDCDEKLFDFLYFSYVLSRNNYAIGLNPKIKHVLDSSFAEFNKNDANRKNNSFWYIQEIFPVIYQYFMNQLDNVKIEEIKEKHAKIKNEAEKIEKIWLDYLNYKFQELTTILESQEMIDYCKENTTREDNRKRFLEIFSHQF